MLAIPSLDEGLARARQRTATICSGSMRNGPHLAKRHPLVCADFPAIGAGAAAASLEMAQVSNSPFTVPAIFRSARARQPLLSRLSPNHHSPNRDYLKLPEPGQWRHTFHASLFKPEFYFT